MKLRAPRSMNWGEYELQFWVCSKRSLNSLNVRCGPLLTVAESLGVIRFLKFFGFLVQISRQIILHLFSSYPQTLAGRGSNPHA